MAKPKPPHKIVPWSFKFPEPLTREVDALVKRSGASRRAYVEALLRRAVDESILVEPGEEWRVKPPMTYSARKSCGGESELRVADE